MTSSSGNERRPYHSPLRERRAAETRHQIIEAAADCFSRTGFAGTTMNRIATEAGVSVESVHAVGNKAALLLEAFRLRYAGQRDWASFASESSAGQFTRFDSAEAALAGIVSWLVRANGDSADLWLALRTAAPTDPSLLQAFEDLNHARLGSTRMAVEWMVRIGVITDAPVEDLEAVTRSASLVMAAETYVQLVRDWGMSEEAYRDWLRSTIPRLRG